MTESFAGSNQYSFVLKFPQKEGDLPRQVTFDVIATTEAEAFALVRGMFDEMVANPKEILEGMSQ